MATLTQRSHRAPASESYGAERGGARNACLRASPSSPGAGAAHPPLSTSTSDQTRRPAEFKHITKRRKRN